MSKRLERDARIAEPYGRGGFVEIRKQLACRIAGTLKDVDKEVDAVYADVWPKHADCEQATKTAIRFGILRGLSSSRHNVDLNLFRESYSTS